MKESQAFTLTGAFLNLCQRDRPPLLSSCDKQFPSRLMLAGGALESETPRVDRSPEPLLPLFPHLLPSFICSWETNTQM